MGSQTILRSDHRGGWKFYLGSSYYWCVTSPFSREGGVSKRWRESQVVFKQECLPNLCYWCGCLKHNNKDCDLWIRRKGSLTPDQQQYGTSLQAFPYLSSYKNVNFVLGYYENRFVHLREMDGKTMVAPSTVAKGCKKSLRWFIKVWKLRNFGGEGHQFGFIFKFK